MQNIIIHIPHSSVFIPQYERSKILLTDAELDQELLLLTDRYTDELYDFDVCDRHVNQVSRLVMDPERFRSDQDEEMSEYGLGAIYNRTSGGKPLRDITASERERMLLKYYDPYHMEFTEKVAKILGRYDSCIILDAHSFPSVPLPYEKDQSDYRPDICIGYEDYHIFPGMEKEVFDFFSCAEGMNVEYNRPFSGSMVPNRFYMRDKRVVSMMLEINRKTYMDESTGDKTAGFENTKDMVRRFIGLLSERYAGVQ